MSSWNRSNEQVRRDFDLPDIETKRVSALMDVLTRIPYVDYQVLDEKKEIFTCFIPHPGIGGVTFKEQNKILYLSPDLEHAAPDIVLAYAAHELAHIMLAHDCDGINPELDPDKAPEEIAAWKQALNWGYEPELRKLKGTMKRRKTREGNLVGNWIGQALGEAKEKEIQKKVGKELEKPAETKAEKLPEKQPEKPPAKLLEKQPEKSPVKSLEKLPDKLPEKPVEKPPEKLPEKLPEKQLEKPPEKQLEKSEASKPLVLIIEDDKDSARLYSRILVPMGFDYQIIPDKESALSRLNEIEPKLVLLDMSLTKWKRDAAGSDILSKIRNDERLKNTRVIVVTAYSVLADEVEDQVEGIVIKPISAEKLKGLIETTV